MKRLVGNLLLLFVLLVGCETDLNISIPSKPVPVLYAIFDDSDSIHQILNEKSFGAKIIRSLRKA